MLTGRQILKRHYSCMSLIWEGVMLDDVPQNPFSNFILAGVVASATSMLGR